MSDEKNIQVGRIEFGKDIDPALFAEQLKVADTFEMFPGGTMKAKDARIAKLEAVLRGLLEATDSVKQNSDNHHIHVWRDKAKQVLEATDE